MIGRTVWANLAIQLMTFGTSVLTARILGPTGRGELALVLLYPQLVANIALFGVDRAVAVLGGRGELVRPVAMIIKLTALLSAPAMVAGYLMLTWRLEDARLSRLAAIYLAYVPPVYFFTLAVYVFNGIGDFSRFNRVRLGFYVVNVVLLFIILVGVPPIALDWVVFANLISVYGGLALAGWFLMDIDWPDGGIAGRNGHGGVGRVLRTAFPFVLPIALSNLSVFAYQIVLSHYADAAALGLFVIYYSYSRLLSPVGSAIGSHLFHLGIVGQTGDMARAFRLGLIVYVISAIPLWMLASWLIPFIFGREFGVSLPVIGVLFAAGVFALSADSLAEFLRGQQKVRVDASGLAIYLVTVGLLGWLLVPLLGLSGMAVAVALADGFRCFYLVRGVCGLLEKPVGAFWRLTENDIAVAGGAARSALRHFTYGGSRQKRDGGCCDRKRRAN